MKQRNLLILFAILVMLVIVALLQNQPQSNPPVVPVATPVNFLGKDLNMTVLDILAIRLRNPSNNQTFIISRNSAGMWTAPQSQGSLDTDAASNIAKAVVLLQYDSTTPVTASTDLQQFGFSPQGQFAVEVLLQNNQSHAIAIGNLLPSRQGYYGQVDTQTQIYLFERGAVDYLMEQLNHPPLT